MREVIVKTHLHPAMISLVHGYITPQLTGPNHHIHNTPRDLGPGPRSGRV